MPELPEVESTVKQLKENLLNSRILDLNITKKGYSHFNVDSPENILINSHIKNISRKGKWILFDLEKVNSNFSVIAHLRMSGRYSFNNSDAKHKHFRFSVETNRNNAIYVDQRRFGTFHIFDSTQQHPTVAGLGPDVLNDKFNTQDLFNKINKSSRPIYTTLLDQSFLAGLGNIYVNESLYMSGISPLRPSNMLNISEFENLLTNIKIIINLAVENKGTTLSDSLYLTPDGTSGGFQNFLKVYGKSDPEITKVKIGGRMAYIHSSQK